jgi:hypothetical protein
LSSILKIIVILCIFSNGNVADIVDEYRLIGECIAFASFNIYVETIVGSFGEEFLMEPIVVDVEK